MGYLLIQMLIIKIMGGKVGQNFQELKILNIRVIIYLVITQKNLLKNTISNQGTIGMIYQKNNLKPKNIPTGIDRYYKEWISWSDFLDTKNIRIINQEWLDYKRAKKIISSFNFKNTKDFMVNKRKYKELKLIPVVANDFYKDQWEGWSIFLGNNKNIRNFKFISNFDAKKVAKKYKISNRKKWREFAKKKFMELKIPLSPENAYKKQWKGWPDFLGRKK